jgi:hypothetical protein
MPEGRFVSKSIAYSGQLKKVSLEADFLFMRMIPHLDRDGRLDGDPDVVRAVACPLRSEMTPELVATCLAELDAEALLVWYEIDNQKVLWFPAFREHQQGMKPDRERPSRLPSVDAQGVKKVRRTPSGLTPDELRTRSPQVKVSKVKSSEVKVSANADIGNWVSEGVEVWSQVAPVGHGRLGKALKPVVTAHGWPDTQLGLKCYIELSEGKTRKIEWFADDAVRWIRLGKMPMMDPDTGAWTERGRLAEQCVKRSA